MPRNGLSRRRTIVMVAAMVAVLLAGEGAARTLSPYLPEPLVYGDDTTQVKVAQLDRLGPACVDLVVAGDSMGRDSFDPVAFTAADPTGRRAYNASLDGASPALLRRWVTEEVVPRLHPSTVVITLSSLDVNTNANAANAALDAYNEAALTADGPGGRVTSWFVGNSTLARYRTELRDPAAVSGAVGRWRAGAIETRRSADGITGLIGPSGEGVSRRSLRYLHDIGTKSFTRDQLLAGFTIDDHQVQEARALIDDLRGGGMQVALVILPVTADYISLHPRGQADFQLFLESTRAIAATTGAPLIDLHDQQRDDVPFADTHHLNGAGQAWFSAALATELAAAGITADRRCG